MGVLIPSGLLGLLPLHAAWREVEGCRRYALDDIAFTYAPSARALLEAQQIAARVRAESILAVDEPQPVSANPLPNANLEVMGACEHFSLSHRKVLGGKAATRQAVLDELAHYTLWHFSCHGSANLAQPLESGLVMAHDEPLTLRDILNLQLSGVRLAVLSACETGLPGHKLPDEVVALPVGLQQAGVAGVVSTLWSVADESTAKLVEKFYVLWKGEGMSPGVALNAAQRWLRDEADGGRWSHPFFWAAFTLTGV